jgi:alanine racemase
MSRPTRVIINLAALQHNFQRVQQLAPGRRVIAMVKANAYGHGLELIARALPLADAFGVASVEEGMRLRQAGMTQPIVLMEGLFHPTELDIAVQQRFTLVIHHRANLDILQQAIVTKPLPVWLKINTGMNRLGFTKAEAASVYQLLSTMPAVQQPVGLMTHLAEADDMTSPTTERQVKVFKQMTSHLPGSRTLANSAGIIGWSNTHGDWVRPGLMLYGVSPFAGKTGEDHQLQPVMTLQSQLIAVYSVKPGERVGYGGTWQAAEEGLLGIAAIGYGDGYPQCAKNGVPVLVEGIECSLAGRVSMDMLAIDLRRHPDAKVGAIVTLWGEGLPVERIACGCGASVYELLTRMTPRPAVMLK